MNSLVLAAMILAASIPYDMQGDKRSSRQPFPETGFWVTQNEPGKKGTIVHYYANSNQLVSSISESDNLDIKRLSVKKYLNKKLVAELAKDSTANPRTKLYEIN
ncbi:hypothetical protein [Dyadobacter sp. CY326]|uniref:hypothetical protein n=1 Tax=Dyadobacter sp. CY326 TaxID=2907300 RepID=UPI001F1B1063|nr:hypothetical protein [Dyadobacter sp. CY326]MCE7065302.1 hypothetical protein [Dyadobacter sp. CY326]